MKRLTLLFAVLLCIFVSGCRPSLTRTPFTKAEIEKMVMNDMNRYLAKVKRKNRVISVHLTRTNTGEYRGRVRDDGGYQSGVSVTETDTNVRWEVDK